MSAWNIQSVPGLHDPGTGALVGFLGADGREYLFVDLYSPTTNYTDVSATPGNATANALRGQAAFAAGQSICTLTNNQVKPTSTVIPVLDASADATLTQILRVVPGNGSFTLYGNANATGNPTFTWLVVN
jgi:hypothetical protein